jgi:hypothetical protein
MEVFMANFKAMPFEAKHAKLVQIIGFLYQQNAPTEAESFCELKACYPKKFPLSKEEIAFREFLAWESIGEHERHRAVRHILAQG